MILEAVSSYYNGSDFSGSVGWLSEEGHLFRYPEHQNHG